MPLPAVTRVSNLQVSPSPTNNNNGFYAPQLTTTKRDAIPTPINGLLIYNTTTNTFQAYQNGVWTNLTTGGATVLNAPVLATVNAPTAANGIIYYDSTTNQLTTAVNNAYVSVYTSPLAQTGNLVIQSLAADPVGGSSVSGEIYYNTVSNTVRARINGLWNTVNTSGNFVLNRTATAISYQALITDVIIGVTSTAAARTITLPAVATTLVGQIITVKDESGAANTNNITVDGSGAETIDGAATVVISANYGSTRVYSSGTAWFTF